MCILKFFFRKITNLLSKKHIYLTKSLSYRRTEHSLSINFDYIRYSTLELCHSEIVQKSVTGNIAELGVYKGDFAKRLNSLFPNKKLYLFDTFEGFDSKDIEIELDKGFSKGNQDFSNTSVTFVLNKMQYPENCIVKKGVFPETANDINDSFCFVSIDADLYEPIYQGLVFFYPKLEKGGYIFVHDFNNDEYKGAREAVINYCKINNISYVPIPDSGGSVIISK